MRTSNMKTSKKLCSLLLVTAIGVTSVACEQPNNTEAKSKISLSAKSLVVVKGKSKILRLKNSKKKVVWKLNTKKYISIKKTGKNKIRITGKKAGTTKVTAKLGKKRYVCKVLVKNASVTLVQTAKPTSATVPTQTAVVTKTATAIPSKEPDATAEATATPDTKIPMKISRKSVNQSNQISTVLSEHTAVYVHQDGVEGLEVLDEYYAGGKEIYYRKGKKEQYLSQYDLFNYVDILGNGEYQYFIGIPCLLGKENLLSSQLGEIDSYWQLEENEEILSCYSENDKIYLTTKMEKTRDELVERYGDRCQGKEDGYVSFDLVLEEESLELLQMKEYLCDKNGTKEWMSTTEVQYEMIPDSLKRIKETYEKHSSCTNMETRAVTLTLDVGLTSERSSSFDIPKGDGILCYRDEEFLNRYGTDIYMDADCTQIYSNSKDDGQSDLALFFKAQEEQGEESDTISYADGVTAKMSNPDFWLAMSNKSEKLLMNDKCIEEKNAEILATKGTNRNDLKNVAETYNGISLRQNLVNSITADANRANYYANGKPVDKEAYFKEIKDNIAQGAARENDAVKYAICTTRTEVKWCPTTDFVGYSATDTDNESVNTAIGVNEPMILKARTGDGKFYWGYTDNCTGWVPAENVAICSSKEEWLDAWEVEAGKKDFLVVTTDRIVTETSFYNPSISARTLTLGTVLKLVEKENIPSNIDGRSDWNNYVVYMPARDADGKYVKEMALISEHSKVNVGYLPFTEKNILELAFECLGNRYGWGGSLDAMDCSLYACQIYRCFGFVLPRNTTWQQKISSLTNISGKTDEEKTELIKKVHVGSIFYFQGHEMLYLGRYNGRTYVISALGSVFDVGDETKRNVFSVSINTLDVKRANGKTWLANLSGINSFELPMA